MFNIGETDEQGRQKRIEHRGKWLRASRTGGVSLRAQTQMAGLNVTANSKHGMRVSTRMAKGTNIALQSGHLRLRGRYGKGPTKLNLSKSGFSVSTKNQLGTFNWPKPNRSSAKLFGVQVRGKNAANLQIIYMLFAAIASLAKLTFFLLVWTVKILWVVLQYLGIGLWKATQGAARLFRRASELPGEICRSRRTRRLTERGATALSDGKVDAAYWSTTRFHAALLYAVCMWGRAQGHDHIDELVELLAETDGEPEASAGERQLQLSLREIRAVGPLLDALVADGTATEQLEEVKGITASIAAGYRKRASSEELSETLFLLDDAARLGGERTVLQDELIELYADAAGLGMEPDETETEAHAGADPAASQAHESARWESTAR